MLIARILSLVSFNTSLASLVTKIAGHVEALTKPSITLPSGEITITGITDGLVDSFYGVPFAAPRRSFFSLAIMTDESDWRASISSSTGFEKEYFTLERFSTRARLYTILRRQICTV